MKTFAGEVEYVDILKIESEESQTFFAVFEMILADFTGFRQK